MVNRALNRTRETQEYFSCQLFVRKGFFEKLDATSWYLWAPIEMNSYYFLILGHL